MMASSKKVINKITNSEIAGVNIASLSDRPNSSARYGIGDFTAQGLKERFDAFPKLVQERLNAIIDALSSQDAAAYITLNRSIGGVNNLYDFLALFCEKVAGEKNISDYISALYTKLNESEPTSETLQAIVDDISAHIGVIDVIAENHEQRIADEETKSADHEKRLEDIEEYVNDALITEDSLAYHVSVPEKSKKTTKVLSIGGMSYKSKNLVDIGTVTFESYKEFDVRLEAGKTYYISTRITSNDTDKTVNQIDMVLEDNTHYYLAFSRDTRRKAKYVPTKNVIRMVLIAGNNYPLSAGDTATYEDFMVCEEDTDVYEPYFAGLRHTKVTEVKSEGANLIPFPYRGTMGAGYTTTINGITFTVLDDGRVMANGTATANARLSLLQGFALPKGVVKVSGGITVDGVKNKAYVVVTAGFNNAWLAEVTSIGTGKFDLTAYEYDSNDIYLMVLNGTTLNNAIFEPMVSIYQEAALPYKPYRAEPLDTLTIPASAQALDGYGVGINSNYYNYLEFVDGNVLYHDICGELVFDGTEKWALQSVNSYGIANFQFSPSPKPTSNIRAICSDRDFDSSLIANATRKGVLANDHLIFVRDDMYKTVAEWKAHLAERYVSGNPLTVVYGFAEPIVTDVTHLFSGDNVLNVEEGGYLTFENEYKYAVPSSIAWRIKSSHKIAFEHSQTKGNPHETTAAEVGAYLKEESDIKFARADVVTNHEERISGIEQYLGGDNFIVDDSIAYQKTVPKNACERARILSVGGMCYKSENLPLLQEAKPSEFKIIGANIWDEEWYNARLIEDTGVFEEVDGYSISSKNYIPVVPKGRYSINKNVWCAFYDKNKTFISTLQVESTNFEIPPNAYFLKFQTEAYAYGPVYKNDIMLNFGHSALPYAKHIEYSLPIASELKNNPFYRLGINKKIYNYADWKNKKLYVKCKKAVFDGSDDENWVIDSAAFKILLPDISSTIGDNLAYFVCDSYEEYVGVLPNIPDGCFYGKTSYFGYGAVAFKNSLVALDITAWREHLKTNPITLVYSLAATEIYDISDILTDDGIIDVEGFGTIIPVNEYNYPVPSSIKYLVTYPKEV